MAKFTGVFRRVELKYLLTPEKMQVLCGVLLPRVRPDAYGRTTVCSIYFDTPDRRLIRASLERPVYKEKLRLRTYGVPEPDSPAFVELKKKFQGVVYKRRIELPYREAFGWLTGGAPPRQETQITREIEWFLAFYGSLTPAAVLCADRTAFDGERDLRITFDENIRWRDGDFDLRSGDGGAPLTAPGDTLMEIKASGGMPLWLSDALSRFGIWPTAFSKYGRAYLAASQTPIQKG